MSKVREMTPVREKPRVALVGSETPLGAEMRDILSHSILGGRVKLIGSEDTGAALLSEEGGEPVVITALDADELNASAVVFFAGTEASSQKAFPKIADGPDRPILIDLTRALEDRPESRLRAPSVEPAGYAAQPGSISVIAHPAAIITVSVLRTLHAAIPIVRAVANAFEPASEHGLAGIDELHKQTMNLMAFQPLPKAIFDEQLAFNILARFGDEAKQSLAAIEERVESHLATLIALNPGVPLPSFRLLQAPVMHGSTVSLWIEFASDTDEAAIEATLSTAGFDVRRKDVEGPNNVGMATQSGIGVGSIARDRNNRRAFWLFCVADNYRLSAENALSVARNELIRSVA